MLKQLTLLQTASVLALALALPATAQEATTEAPAPEAPATDTPVEGSVTAETATPAQDVTRDTVVATVNGTDITLGQLLVAVRQLPPQYQQLPPDVIFSGVTDQLIQQELLAETVTTPSAATEIALQNQRRSLLANEVIGDIATGAVSDEAVQAAYDAQYASAEPGTEWDASHILVVTEEEANAAIERITAGEAFEAVATELSTDTGSGAQGGALGWFTAGMMVPEFEQAVAGLEKGALSAPVQSQFGWHVIRLNDTRPTTPPTLDEVRGEIEGQLQQEAVQARLTELEGQAEVTRPAPGQFDPAVLNDATLLDD
ncbi:peptidylprolyl isomerase [Rubellimicrobium aerolatum]|uniref:Parvulin-like PPIase n=1 Tax=Rubellimicrobium aerolatum TaxID=490979 RepID=A0ABW0SAB5_9RHOB|nr:peptidylprolyl isomerase [Rubellimicrobium aerolatum]MBP1805194.1 peptidyl-prolyl cis-trans isomerase C [Rubellimicrobium aerolatum]